MEAVVVHLALNPAEYEGEHWSSPVTSNIGVKMKNNKQI